MVLPKSPRPCIRCNENIFNRKENAHYCNHCATVVKFDRDHLTQYVNNMLKKVMKVIMNKVNLIFKHKD